MKYKVTNKLEQRVKYKDIYFAPLETKILSEKPTSDKFNIEQVRKKEKKTKRNGGIKNGKRRFME